MAEDQDKKEKSNKIWKNYEIKEGEIKKPKFCPRCGAGVIMAEHKDRWHCGRCGYTAFKKE